MDYKKLLCYNERKSSVPMQVSEKLLMRKKRAQKLGYNQVKEGLLMMTDKKIKNSNELEFAVFCIENVAAKLGVDAERVYQAFTEKSNILNGYIVPEYEVLHTQSREYIVDDLLDVMKERGVEV